MNPILLVLALLFLIPIVKEIRLLILIKCFSKKIIGRVINIDIKETFTRNLTKMFQNGNNKLIKVSYKFIFNNKEFQVVNDEVLAHPSTELSKLKKDDNINIYVYIKNSKIKNTWLFEPRIINIIPYLLLFMLLLLVAYLSADMYYSV